MSRYLTDASNEWFLLGTGMQVGGRTDQIAVPVSEGVLFTVALRPV
jgi:hypothetical protein